MGREVTAVDRKISRRLKALRTKRGLTQAALAERIGISYQQYQRYENGSNRITSGRLKKLADVLDVDLHVFFDARSDGNSRLSADATEIARMFERIRDESKRNYIKGLLMFYTGTYSHDRAR